MGKPYKDLTGKRFGHLTVLKYNHGDDDGNHYWLCECDCPDRNEILAKGRDLSRGHKTSCGCQRHRPTRNDLTGKRYGRLTVLAYDHSNSYGVPYWLCECDCGTTKIISTPNLTKGHATSCGCYQRECRSINHATHRSSNSRLYGIWQNMKNRCMNERADFFEHYGGRGVDICDEWLEFENFQEWSLNNGYDPKLTIDRINNDSGYSPENCRWADRHVQANNKSNNRYVEYGGERNTMANWARKLGVTYGSLKYRLNHGIMRDFEEYFGDNH